MQHQTTKWLEGNPDAGLEELVQDNTHWYRLARHVEQLLHIHTVYAAREHHVTFARGLDRL